MAGIIDSLRNISTDMWWFPKLLCLGYLAFLLIFNIDYLMAHQQSLIALASITSVLFMGSVSILMKRNINNEAPILPGILDFPELILRSVITTLFMAPASLFLYFILKYLIENPFFEQPIHGIIIGFVTLIFTPFIFIPTVLFAARSKIKDGFRFDLILKGGGDFIVKILLYIIQVFFFLYIPSFLFYLAIKAMMGEESSVIYMFIGFAMTVTFFSFFSYISDLYEESIPVIKSKKIKNKVNHTHIK